VLLPAAVFTAAFSSNIFKRLLLSSRNASKLPQRVLDAGTGLFFSHVPFA